MSKHTESFNLTANRKLTINRNLAETASTSEDKNSYSKSAAHIQIDYLPKQIDNEFLKDLFKKEHDHILDSYVVNHTKHPSSLTSLFLPSLAES